MPTSGNAWTFHAYGGCTAPLKVKVPGGFGGPGGPVGELKPNTSPVANGDGTRPKVKFNDQLATCCVGVGVSML